VPRDLSLGVNGGFSAASSSTDSVPPPISDAVVPARDDSIVPWIAFDFNKLYSGPDNLDEQPRDDFPVGLVEAGTSFTESAYDITRRNSPFDGGATEPSSTENGSPAIDQKSMACQDLSEIRDRWLSHVWFGSGKTCRLDKSAMYFYGQILRTLATIYEHACPNC